MVIVVSNPATVADESIIIEDLFEAGLEVFHLRKPEIKEGEMCSFLDKIDPKWYSRIALHQHHQVVERFGIKRLHYTEARRKRSSVSEFERQKLELKILSTSIHEMEDYDILSNCFEYCFFGPVFNSISKQGYQSVVDENFKVTGNRETKLIALGGVVEINCSKAKGMGFSGIALLGAIWQSADPVARFKTIREKWLQLQLPY